MSHPIESNTIVKAAQRLFSRLGYRKTSVDDIANEGGISRASVYTYFKNKARIWEAAVTAAVDDWRDQILHRVLEESSTAAQVRAMCVTAYQFMRNSEFAQKLVTQTLLQQQHDEQTHQLTVDNFLNVRIRVEELLEQGVQAGTLDLQSTHNAALFLQVVNRGFMASIILGDKELDKPEALQGVADLVVRALGAAEARSGPDERSDPE